MFMRGKASSRPVFFSFPFVDEGPRSGWTNGLPGLVVSTAFWLFRRLMFLFSTMSYCELQPLLEEACMRRGTGDG